MEKGKSPRLIGVAELFVAMVATNLSNVLLVVLSGKGFSALMVAGLVTAIGGALMVLPITWAGFKYDLSTGRKRIAFPIRWTGFRMHDLRAQGWNIAKFSVVSLVLNLFYGEGVVNCSLAVFVALETAGLLFTPALMNLFSPVTLHVWKNRSLRGFSGPLVSMAGLRGFKWPLVTMAGVLFLIQPGAGTTNPLGIACAFLTGAGMAVRLVLTKKLPAGQGNLVRGWSGFNAGLGLMLLAPLVETNNPVLSGWLVIVVLAAALTNTTIPSVAEVSATRKLEATTVSVILAATPVVALAIACLQGWRLPSLAECTAIVLVVAGAVGAARSDSAEQAALTALSQGDALEQTDEPDAPTGTSKSENKKPKPQRLRRKSKKAPSWKKHAGRRKAGRRRPRPKKKH
ncbi:hypothetical protein GCM10023195_58240 [Actinoallomurus liliacearum]|uniref:EamA domain-containing protein n=1 Tax=Actinoallomurus liliacearum TaxID=1080073 RepID=A0ABP8TPU3_9ACTN